MRFFTHTRLWAMFKDYENTNNDFVRADADAAIDEFTSELIDYCREERDPAERIRTLRFARGELEIAQEHFHGEKTSVALSVVIKKAIRLIDCELEIVRMELEHPQRFLNVDKTPISNVLWASKGSKVKILELAGGLFRLGELTTFDGSELCFVDIVRAFEAAFNTDLRSLYIQRNQSRNRKKSTAPFLYRLAALVEQDAESIL